MKRIMLVLLAIVSIVAMILAFGNVAFTMSNVALAATPPPYTSIIPRPSTPAVTSFDFVVNIPDANLRSALHTLTGVPSDEDIHRSDLAALTSPINLASKNISNAEGIQYCKNIEFLSLSKNSITNLPSMTGMTHLVTLRLSGCGLNAWPTGKLPPSLKTLDLSKNNISTTPSPFTDPCGTWTTLDLSGNDLSEFPAWITDLTGLKTLQLSNNNIDEIPEYIDDMAGLESLSISGNDLSSIPDTICSMTSLKSLSVSNNNLYSLPANIGNYIDSLSAINNRLESLPNSIGASPDIYFVDVRLNRLTHLPSNFDDHDYDFINIEFNFIDMSPGSADRAIIDNTISMTKEYERQLTPVTELTALPTSESVTLTWQPGEDGSDDDVTWQVTGYVVYLYDGGMNKLDDIDVDVQTYTHTGLTPETAYQYRVGVNYHIEYLGSSIKADLRGYTRVEVTTLSVMSSPAQTTAAEVSPATSEEPSAQPSSDAATPTVIPAGGEAENGRPAFPAWATVTIAAMGAGALGTGLTLGILKYIKAKKTSQKGIWRDYVNQALYFD